MSEVTNRDLYNAINELRSEFSGSIQRLDDKFMNLEAGRLTRLEAQMNQFELAQAKRDSTADRNQAVLSTKFLVIQTIAYVIFFFLVQALVNRLYK